MSSFQEGYSFFEKCIGSCSAANMSGTHIDSVETEIEKLANDLNAFKGFHTDTASLKGDIAEFWHSDTFNINAIAKDSKNRTFVDRSHDFASADISSNFGKEFGLKYYKSGEESAKQQAKSVFERYKEYQAQGGKDSIDDFLSKRGLDDIDKLLDDPIYKGQDRIIPKDQVKEAEAYLRRKIAEETAKRPEQVQRYQETLERLSDRLRDDNGTESVPLSKEEAQALAALAKEGKVTKEELAKLGISTEDIISYEIVFQRAFKSGLSAATVSLVLCIAPEIYRSIEQLIRDGELDEEQLKQTGVKAITSYGEGFIRGSVSAAITTASKAGLWGEALKSIEPSVVGAVTVIVVDAIKNSYNVATGRMARSELALELIKEMYVSTCSLIGGGISQSVIEIPVFGFMLGSFIGSVLGSLSYEIGYKRAISFCVDTGFTMFGLVEQDYELPTEILKTIGIEVFEYERFEPDCFESELFQPDIFEPIKFEPELFVTEDGLKLSYLRRGVIGFNRIGYCSS